MTVTCDTVRRAFGEFQCCPPSCHEPFEGDNSISAFESLCCSARYQLRKNGIHVSEPTTHPALLKAIEEQDA